ncbi:MAG TPA: UDP-N-acetylmuramoyl-tripeptide--D-alanyl-D-alanine ligase [Candidatus Mediterraneibacter stercorigallinarum]|uniref:UDP-N-acetylmuramoyl-tripeptide--D-alanyl-D-alanine ligase n=1 Tax=Candidatus Mediterraneibacter stercorigallinarum TaxID=2838686 RepID=A0A9D2IJK7_9FIRM|nr:UDP-N-acetylmuramoyl-tripeptide--D-alanyl-D-alanine ligase [Candidatus Mediterraneibacter stercorigallinarum]
MRHMSLQEITAACGGTYHGDPALSSREVSSVVIDSRKAEQDSLFIAIKGARVDGHTFIPQVMEKGALCAVSEQDLGEVPYVYIRVDSCAQALKDIAEHYRRSLDIKVVGISGSVGKTSTKEMIASVLSQKYHVLKTEGNFNNEIGLPLTVFRLREEHEVAVLEMGISGFGEMTRLAKIARPDICVITNIGVAHLENLGSRDGILKAKTEMFAYMNPRGTIILNGDDDKLRSFTPENGITPVYFGLDAACPFHAEHIENRGLKGTDAEFVTPASRFSAHINIPGGHMVYNALAGAAVGYALGMTDQEIARGIEANVPIAGRNNLIETSRYTLIDDCYNANPASMKASLDVLACADTRTAAILGDMFELGENSAKMHYEVGAHAADAGINVLIGIGELSAETVRGAEETAAEKGLSMEIRHFASKEDFFRESETLLKEKDTILIKASHGMEFTEIVDRLKEPVRTENI